MARNPAVLVSLLADWDGKDLDKAIREIQKMRDQTQTASDKFKQMGDKLKAVGGQISNVGGQLTKSVTLPIVGIGAAAAAMSIEFETSMAKITGLVGIAADEVAGMETAVLQLAGKTAKSPKELADALFVVTSAGLRGKDALDALEFAAKAGAAGLGETNDIARALAGSMNAYGSNVVDAARATDVIVATARAGNFETSQFAGAIGRVLPFAKQAGASLEDMGGAVALLTRTNGDAAQSVTQVQALFRAFVVPTEEAKKALKAVGLSAADMREAISEDGLPAALDMLDKKLGGNREQLGKLLGSSEAAAAAFQILDADAQTITDTFGAVNQATGMTNEAFGVVAETSGFKLQQAFTEIKTSLIEIGDVIAPFVNQFVGKLRELIGMFQALSPQQKQMIVLVAAIAAAIGPLLVVIGTLITALGAIVGAIGAISLPVVAVVAGIAAFIAILVLLWTKSEAFRNGVIGIWNAIRGAVTQVIDQLKKKLDENRERIDMFKDGLATVWQFLNTYVIPAIAKFYEIYLSTLIKVIGAAITALIDVAAYWFDVGVAAVDVGKKIAEFATKVGNAINDAVEYVRALPGRFIKALGNAREWLIQTGKDMIQGLLDGAGSILPKIGQFFLDKLPGWIVVPFKRALGIASPSKVFSEFGQNIVDGLSDALINGGDRVREAMQTGITNAIKTEGKRLKDELDRQREMFADYASGIYKTITGSISLEDALPEYDEQGNRVGSTFIEALQAQADRAIGFTEKINTLLTTNLSREALDMVLQAGVVAGSAIADELIGGGETTINETNRLIAATSTAAEAVAVQTAQKWYGTGVETAHNAYLGFKANFGKDGPARKALMGVMDNLAAAAARAVRIDVAVTRNINEVVTRVVQEIRAPGIGVEAAGATGAIVRRPTFALIGEAGPEALIPLDRTRGNAPISDLAGGGITINVNAGMGTDGAEVGRQIVDALKAYERRNGPVYASA